MLHFLGSVRRARVPADAVPARRHREPEAARRDRAHRAAPVHRARRRARSPLVLVLDDMQWADDDTLALRQRARARARRLAGRADRPRRGPRCSCTPAAGARARSITSASTCATSSPTTPSRCSATCCRACGEVPDDIVEDAVEMTGGNPAFLEQLVRLFLANGTIDASRRDVAARSRQGRRDRAADQHRGGDRGAHRRARERRARAAREGRGVRQRVLGVGGGRDDAARAAPPPSRRRARSTSSGATARTCAAASAT